MQMDLKGPRVVSLFSGAGGLDIGFGQAGFHTVYATDVWDIACETLKKNKTAQEVFCGDIREIDFQDLKKKIGEVDCLIGGPPCPPYSQTRHYLIGKADGFEDERAGFAVPEYFRALKELCPKVFLFENVDGFTFKTHQYEFAYLKRKADELGYCISCRVVNCANYGIPQTRKRFFCVGVKKGLPEFAFPRETHEDVSKQARKENAEQVRKDNAERAREDAAGRGSDGVLRQSGKLPWVTCQEAIGEFDNITKEEEQQRPGAKDYELLCQIPAGDNYLYFTEKRGYPEPKFKWKSRYWTFLLKLTPHRPSWTIQASFSTNQGPFHWRNRFLRIEELKRLQTIPDTYELCGEFKDQWRQVGNAVPSKMAYVMARAIKEAYFDGTGRTV